MLRKCCGDRRPKQVVEEYDSEEESDEDDDDDDDDDEDEEEDSDDEDEGKKDSAKSAKKEDGKKEDGKKDDDMVVVKRPVEETKPKAEEEKEEEEDEDEDEDEEDESTARTTGRTTGRATARYLPSPRTTDALKKLGEMQQKQRVKEAMVNAQFLRELGMPTDFAVDFDISAHLLKEKKAVRDKGLRKVEKEAKKAEETHLSKAPSAEQTVDAIAGRGVSVRQLLEFYKKYSTSGKIKEATSVEDVLREIVVPETAEKPSSYMESQFMKSLGGPQKPTKIVALSWQSSFLQTLANIVLDAAKWSPAELAANAFAWPKGAVPSMQNVVGVEGGVGKFDPDALLKSLDATVLNQAYWVCIFAINEHTAIVGECTEKCMTNLRWRAKPEDHFKADPCLICKAPKRLPCTSGWCRKYPYGSSACEASKFPQLLAKVKSLIVSLDGSLEAVKSLNVQFQMAEALEASDVEFRPVRAFPLDKTARQLLLNGNAVPAAEVCQANHGGKEKAWILDRMKESKDGVKHPAELLNTTLNVRLGKLAGLAKTSAKTKAMVRKLGSLSMDFTWARDELTSTDKLVGPPPDFEALKLSNLQLRFEGCSKLTNLSAVGKGLGTQKELSWLSLEMRGCSQMSEAGLSDLVGWLPASLKVLDLDLKNCFGLDDKAMQELSTRLPREMQKLDIDLQNCSGISSNGLGQILSRMLKPTGTTVSVKYSKPGSEEETVAVRSAASKKSLNLDLRKCPSFGDQGLQAMVNGLDIGILQFGLRLPARSNITDKGMLAVSSVLPMQLDTLAIELMPAGSKDSDGTGTSSMPGVNTSPSAESGSGGGSQECTGITDAYLKDLAKRLPGSAKALSLNLTACPSFTSLGLASLAAKLPPNVETLTLHFRGCKIDSAGLAALAAGLPTTMQSLGLVLRGCADIADGGLSALAAKLPAGLTRLSLDFAQCRELTDAGLVALAAALPKGLTSLGLELEGCEKVSDAGLAALAAALPPKLERLTLNLQSTAVTAPRNESGVGLDSVKGFTSKARKPRAAKPAPPMKLDAGAVPAKDTKGGSRWRR